MKPQLHFSGLTTLWQCGIKFDFRYIQKIKRPPTPAIVVGKGVDEAMRASGTKDCEEVGRG